MFNIITAGGGTTCSLIKQLIRSLKYGNLKKPRGLKFTRTESGPPKRLFRPVARRSATNVFDRLREILGSLRAPGSLRARLRKTRQRNSLANAGCRAREVKICGLNQGLCYWFQKLVEHLETWLGVAVSE